VNSGGEAFCTNCGSSLTAAPTGVGAPSGVTTTAPTGAGQPRLVVESDNAAFDLSGKSEVLIGREDPVSNIYPDVDLTPHRGEEDGVSRLHAKMLINGGQYLLEDENSTNYTFVNRQKLQPKVPTPVKDGDEIRLGRAVLRFHAS
jgi:pSer/pThr/pTyr-binding forkhead associated (FHA) protein